MPKGEQWKPVPGREGRYEVSDCGRVRRLRYRNGDVDRLLVEPKIMRCHKVGEQVTTNLSGPHQIVKIAALVLETFVGPRPNGYWVFHLDDDKTNCRLSNLRWAPRGEAYGRTEKEKKPIKLGTGGKRFNHSKKRAVKDKASARSKCRECGAEIGFDIHKTTTLLLRLNLDGSLHTHQESDNFVMEKEG